MQKGNIDCIIQITCIYRYTMPDMRKGIIVKTFKIVYLILSHGIHIINFYLNSTYSELLHT